MQVLQWNPLARTAAAGVLGLGMALSPIGAVGIAGAAHPGTARLATALPTTAHPGAARPGAAIKITAGHDGGQLDQGAYNASISADGRFIAFESYATNLVPGPSGTDMDVFVHDSVTGTTELISRGVDGGPADDYSGPPEISGDGRYVAFTSYASNLVVDEGEPKLVENGFLHDRRTGKTIMLPGGVRATPDLSHDGRYAAYIVEYPLLPEDTNDVLDVYLYDRDTARVTLVSRTQAGTAPDEGSYHPTISGDGRWVAYTSRSPDIVPEVGPDPGSDLFLYDRVRGTTEEVSVNDAGASAVGNSWEASVSHDGRFVAFTASVSNLVPGTSDGDAAGYLRDRKARTTTAISALPGSSPVRAFHVEISPDGRYVAYVAEPFYLGPHHAEVPRGSYIYRYDRVTRRSIMVPPFASRTGPMPESMGSWEPAISRGGRSIAFASGDSNLVANDTNGLSDIFLARLH